MPNPNSALILVDLQPDFLPGGPLGVPEGDTILPTVVALAGVFDTVVATQDWHPPDHGSFAANHEGHAPGEVIQLDGLDQILWPTHCVAGTPGAELLPQIRELPLAAVFRKGTDPRIDSYSGFFDNGRRASTGLDKWLEERDITDVAICGLALDYCVKFTALDAIDLGLQTTLIRDATRAVNLQPGDGERAVEAIREAGGEIVDSSRFLGDARAP